MLGRRLTVSHCSPADLTHKEQQIHWRCNQHSGDCLLRWLSQVLGEMRSCLSMTAWWLRMNANRAHSCSHTHLIYNFSTVDVQCWTASRMTRRVCVVVPKVHDESWNRYVILNRFCHTPFCFWCLFLKFWNIICLVWLVAIACSYSGASCVWLRGMPQNMRKDNLDIQTFFRDTTSLGCHKVTSSNAVWVRCTGLEIRWKTDLQTWSLPCRVFCGPFSDSFEVSHTFGFLSFSQAWSNDIECAFCSDASFFDRVALLLGTISLFTFGRVSLSLPIHFSPNNAWWEPYVLWYSWRCLQFVQCLQVVSSCIGSLMCEKIMKARRSFALSSQLSCPAALFQGFRTFPPCLAKRDFDCSFVLWILHGALVRTVCQARPYPFYTQKAGSTFDCKKTDHVRLLYSFRIYASVEDFWGSTPQHIGSKQKRQVKALESHQ